MINYYDYFPQKSAKKAPEKPSEASQNNQPEVENFEDADPKDKEHIFDADVVVWNNGEIWQACLDTSFCRDLSTTKVFTSYRKTYKFDCIEGRHVVVNISNDGSFIEVCATDNLHGTLVTQVAAAYDPSNSENNGVAPGAQIISVNHYEERIFWEESFRRVVSVCEKKKNRFQRSILDTKMHRFES